MPKKKTNREIGYRMYEEVYRLFGTSTKAGMKLGCDRSNVSHWSTGLAPRAIHLAELLNHGGDVVYVLTGERSSVNG